MSGLAWMLILSAPALLWCVLLALGAQRAGAWVWLACVPALLACAVAPEPAVFTFMWPGASLAIGEAERPWLFFTALLWACASLYASQDLRGDRRASRFWTFWLLALTGNLLLLVAQDLGSFYVGFSMMSLAGYGLIVHLRGPEPRQAGRLYLQLAILGELLLFSAIVMRLFEGDGMTDLTALQAIATEPVTAVLLLIGLGLKAGFWPLHVWLPLAHPAAPAAASAVLSGAMIKAGVFGLWRLLPAQDPLLEQLAPVLLGVAFVSMFYGVLLGLIQARPKTVLAYSSISQMGYLLAILSLGWLHPDGRPAMGALLALFAVHHGLAKGALFLGAGMASHLRLNRVQWVLLALPALALAGLPLTSGSAVKLIFKEALEDSYGPWLVFLLSLGSVGTALLMIRAFWLMRRSMPAGAADPAAIQWAPWLVLCLAAVILPWLLPGLRQHSLYGLTAAAWSLIWPALAALFASWAAHRCGLASASLRKHLPAPARHLSLSVKRLTQPRLGAPEHSAQPPWRFAERLANRLLAMEPVSTTGWLLIAMLLVGWVMAL